MKGSYLKNFGLKIYQDPLLPTRPLQSLCQRAAPTLWSLEPSGLQDRDPNYEIHGAQILSNGSKTKHHQTAGLSSYIKIPGPNWPWLLNFYAGHGPPLSNPSKNQATSTVMLVPAQRSGNDPQPQP